MDAGAALRAELAAMDALPWLPDAVVRYIPAECAFRAPRQSFAPEEGTDRVARWLGNVFATVLAVILAPFEELFRARERRDVAADVLWTSPTWVRRELRDMWLVFGPGEIAVVGAAQVEIRGELVAAAEVLWRSGPGFVTRIRVRRALTRDLVRLQFWDGSSARFPVRRGTAKVLRPVVRGWPRFQ